MKVCVIGLGYIGLPTAAMFANAARFADAYHAAISPLCAETGLPPAAADIKM